MFTGIIRQLGIISDIKNVSSQEVLLTITSPLSSQLHEGDSVAVNGVCLTVLSFNDTSWQARLMAETLSRTNLGALTPGSTVNLEQPLQLTQLLDGHLVQGHVDGVGDVLAITAVGDDRVFTIKPPENLLPYFIPKGSVALDGVSLTIVDVMTDTFTVSMMPYTLANTHLGKTSVGYKTNIEVDMIGKYVKRFVDFEHRR